MSATAEPEASELDEMEPSARRLGGRVHRWSRRAHYYLGLYLLLFTWFFAVSGLVLNHSRWRVAQFWERRNEATRERPIVVPDERGDMAIARALMGQLAIVGEVGEVRRSADGAGIAVEVVRPGHVYKVDARLDSARARVTEIGLDAWGAMDALHKFTGVRMDDAGQTRDWWLTRIWSLAMDAVGVGLVVLALSGVYLWWRLVPKRASGAIALALGVACCAFFLFGLGTLMG
jgi:hypothetical protein